MQALLEDLGLTESEAKVYLALLDLGESTVGPIVDKASVAYSKSYLLLDKLAQKGLVSHIIKSNTKHFSATEPTRLLELVRERRERVDDQERELLGRLPALQERYEQLRETERVEIFEGYSGLKSIYDEGLQEMEEGSEVLVLGASHGVYSAPEQYRSFFSQINAKRQEKRIHYRIIYNENVKDSFAVSEWESLPRTSIRYFLRETPASINIHADRVLIIYWKDDGPRIFAISSSTVAESFRTYFEAIWDVARPK